MVALPEPNTVRAPQAGVGVFIGFLGDPITVGGDEFLGLGYLIAVARREGYPCALITIPAGEDDQAVKQAADLNPYFVGLCLVADLPRFIHFGQALRARLGPSAHICVGGPVATHAGEMLLKHPDCLFIDSIVRGEGESVICEVMAAARDGKPVDGIEGVATRGHAQPLISLAKPIENLDDIPWPIRDQLQDRSRRPNPKVALVLSGRGCVGRCVFCSVPNARNNIGGKVWRGRSPQDVVDEIEALTAQYGVDDFGINDSTFECPGGPVGKQRIRRIAELILQRGLRIYYHFNTQACSWTEDDADLLHFLFKSGLQSVYMGIESGSARILESMKKRSNLSDNRRAIRLFRQNHIYIQAGFITFYPYADWQDLEESANFILTSFGHLFLMYFPYRLKLLPGAEIVERLEAEHLLAPGYYQNLDPFAYQYVNRDIGRLAGSVNQLVSQCRNIAALFGADFKMHGYLSHFLRTHGHLASAGETIRAYQDKLVSEQTSLTRFNEAIWQDFLTCAKSNQAIPASLIPRIEERYAESIQSIKAMRLDLGLKLGRQGVFRSPPKPADQ